MRRDENVLNCYHSHKILIDIVMMPMFDLRCLVRSETGNLFMTRWNIREAKYSSHFLRVFCPFHSYSLLWLCPRISVFRVQIEDKCDLKNLAVIIWPDSRILPLYPMPDQPMGTSGTCPGPRASRGLALALYWKLEKKIEGTKKGKMLFSLSHTHIQ